MWLSHLNYPKLDSELPPKKFYPIMLAATPTYCQELTLLRGRRPDSGGSWRSRHRLGFCLSKVIGGGTAAPVGVHTGNLLRIRAPGLWS